MRPTNINRHNKIFELVQREMAIRLVDLQAFFPGISLRTLSRDLDQLSSDGLIERVHGGAKILSDQQKSEYSFEFRSSLNSNEKKSIAKLALKYIEEQRSIYFDSGTTVMELAKILPDIQMFTITNAPNIALEINKRKNATIILPEGHLTKESISITGDHALEFLDRVNIDIAFMTTLGFTLEKGFTNPDYNECKLKRKVIEEANKVIMLLDHTKVGRNLPFTIAYHKDVDVIISDKPFPKEIQKCLNKTSIVSIFPERKEND